MAKALRVEYPGAVYYLTVRGNGGRAIYPTDSEKEAFLSTVTDICRDFNWLLYAYCLMDDHYHLLLETPDANLSKGMKRLNGRYAGRFNRIHGTGGHLFRSGFQSIIIEKERYLLEICRYTVLNPVRAGLVGEASQWRWSSYRMTAGLDRYTGLVDTDWILDEFTPDISWAVKAYRRFVDNGIKAGSPWENLKGGYILGSYKYARKIRLYIEESNLPTLVKRRVTRSSLARMFANVTDISTRNRLICKACREYGYPQQEVAEFLGLHHVSISRIIGKSKKTKR